MSRHQKVLRVLVAGLESEREVEAITAAGGVKHQIVDYNLGFFSIDDRRITLHHDHVPKFFASLLALPKIRRLFTGLYPVLFIDEYQDTDPAVMAAISEHFFAAGGGPVTGLFGDHWQTIYRNDFDLAAFPNVIGIDKGSNFRSVPAVVNVLNNFRPQLPQAVRDPQALGEARFFHCNGINGERRTTSPYKDDLQEGLHAATIEGLKARLIAEGWNFAPDRTKILMLTHNAIAAKQGYPNIAGILEHKEAFVKKEDPLIACLIDLVEPVCTAYMARQFGEMFSYLGGAPSILSYADKVAWAADMDRLIDLRLNGTIGEIVDHLKATARPRLSERVLRREAEILAFGPEETEDQPRSLKRHRALRNVPYSELVEVKKFVEGFTPFATQHSVKGAQFENVLVVLSGGWNHYNWPRFLEQLHTKQIPTKQIGGFHRARNLFYVAISRPEIRLAVLATQTLSADALTAARNLFGPGNVLAAPAGA